MARDIKKVDDTCKVKCLDNNKIVDAVVLDFREHVKLIVVLNKTIKLTLNWDGKRYLGKGSGLEFISDGPNITMYNTGR